MSEIAPIDPRDSWDEPDDEDFEPEPEIEEDRNPLEPWEVEEMWQDMPTLKELPPLDEEDVW